MGRVVGCIVRVRGWSVEYDSAYGCQAYRFQTTFGVATVGVDCGDLVMRGIVRRDADGFCDAVGRHAPRLGAAVCDVVALVAAVGIGDSTGAKDGTTLPGGEVETGFHVGRAPGNLFWYWPGFSGADHFARGDAESVAEFCPYGSICSSLVAQVL